MSRHINQLYEFGRFRLDATEHQLLRDGVPVPLRPKVFDILLVLVENSGHLVEKEELLEKVWPGQFVEEGNLNKNISVLRHALGESPNSHPYIETVPKLGYRFVAAVGRVPNVSSELTIEKHARTRVVIEQQEETNGHAIVDCESPPDNLGSANGEPSAIMLDYGQPKTNIYRIADLVKRHEVIAMLALTTLVAVVVTAGFLFSRFTAQHRPAESTGRSSLMTLSDMSLKKITNTGGAGVAAISPDGKYIAYALTGAGRQSLWLRQVATDSNTQIAPPAGVLYAGLTFSHNGEYIYYVKSDQGSLVRGLYRMPILGGVPTRLVGDVLDSVTLSPDDKQIAFARLYHGRGECALIVANADGSGERELAARKSPDVFGSPAWSPDGKVIASRTGNGDRIGLLCNVVEVRVADGNQRNITRQGWPWIRDVAWLRDGNGLLMNATDQSGRNQIWRLSYPDGEAHRITNDFDKYAGLSLSGNSNTLVTTLTTPVWNVWVAPNDDPNLSGSEFPVDVTRARKIATGFNSLSWTPDGRVVFPSYVSGSGEIWSEKWDGTDLKQLTSGGGTKIAPIVSPDGRYVVYASDTTGAIHLWRVNIDGANPVPLTSGDGGENYPCFSPDGKWVIYTQLRDWTLWRVSIDGGAPIQLTSAYSKAPSVSPDGKLIAYYYREKQQDLSWKIAIVPFEGGAPVKFFDVPHADFQSWDIRWTRDGRALTYEAGSDGGSNIWRQPLDGGRPTPLTNFITDRILSFAWSPDGKKLACIRGNWLQDIVLISNFQ